VSFLFSWMNETYVFSKANVRLVAAALRLQHIVLAYMARGAWYMVLTHGATQNLHRCDHLGLSFIYSFNRLCQSTPQGPVYL